ncbi:hypothetical protein [Nocardiopsis sp. YSL2]|uniref:hypothetical protein n=1 Tax=Nocardiopsis sp. YSL2 TaxID=2939492 RepID=UPI0026F475FB|nr:hypothetical protein [Nocardiopsis sp. YSL2]
MEKKEQVLVAIYHIEQSRAHAPFPITPAEVVTKTSLSEYRIKSAFLWLKEKGWLRGVKPGAFGPVHFFDGLTPEGRAEAERLIAELG